MGRREKYERRLLRAAAKGSLKRICRLVPEPDDSSEDQNGSNTSQFSDGSFPESDSDRGEGSLRARDGRTSRKRKVEVGRVRKKEKSKGRVKETRSYQQWCRTGNNEHRKKRRRKHNHPDVDVNCQDLQGWTPLHHAAFAGALEAVELLVSHGADFSIADVKGQTAAHVAARQSHIHVVSALAERGANLMQPDLQGKTPNDILSVRLEALRERIFANSTQPRQAEYMEPNEWSERLWGNMSDDEGGAGGTWGCAERSGVFDSGLRGEAAELGLDEDSWRDEIAKAVERKRREKEEAERKQARDAAEATWGSRVKGPWSREGEQERREAEEERLRGSRRILEEEQAKDRAWREMVLEGKTLQQQTRYLERWATFATSCNLGLGLSDVPFPVEPGKEVDLGKVLLYGVPPAEHRKRIREEVLKWHPDKFVQKWGLRLKGGERDKVLTRVKEISQQVQEVYSSLPKDAS